MLIDTLKRGVRALFGREASSDGYDSNAFPGVADPEAADLNVEVSLALRNRHVDILYGPGFGTPSFVEIWRRAVADTGGVEGASDSLRHLQCLAYLAHYFEATLGIAGARAECSAEGDAVVLLLCRIAQTTLGAFDGAGFYQIDCDRQTRGGAHGEPQRLPAWAHFPATVRVNGSSFFARHSPDDSRWAFVHLDTPQHKTAEVALAYFYPRLLPGGVLIVEGYDGDDATGMRPVWERFCDHRDIPFQVLDSGQAVVWHR